MNRLLRHAPWFAECAWSTRLTAAALLGLVVLVLAVVALAGRRAAVALRFAVAAMLVGGLVVYSASLAEDGQRRRADSVVGALSGLPVSDAGRERLRQRGYAEAAVCRTEGISFATPLIGGGAAVLVLALLKRPGQRPRAG